MSPAFLLGVFLILQHSADHYWFYHSKLVAPEGSTIYFCKVTSSVCNLGNQSGALNVYLMTPKQKMRFVCSVVWDESSHIEIVLHKSAFMPEETILRLSSKIFRYLPLIGDIFFFLEKCNCTCDAGSSVKGRIANCKADFVKIIIRSNNFLVSFRLSYFNFSHYPLGGHWGPLHGINFFFMWMLINLLNYNRFWEPLQQQLACRAAIALLCLGGDWSR